MKSRTMLLIAISLWAVVLNTVPAYATFPGLNGRIAFQAQVTPDAHIQIYTVKPSGHDLRQITKFADADAVNPDWSPDGRQILFEIDRDHAPFCSVALMNGDGSGIVELTANEDVCENDPHFTPDGASVVFDRFDGVGEAFWIMDITGNNRQRLGPCCADPNVSPDGEKVSYVAFNGEPFGSALYTTNIDGTDPFQVRDFSFDVAIKQDWSPDGRHLVFTKDGDEPKPGISANIATVRPDGTHMRLLTHYTGGDVQAFVGSYSPDGRWIVFRLEDHGSFGLFKMWPDGSHMQPILPLSNFKPRFIAWGAEPSEVNDEDDRGK